MNEMVERVARAMAESWCREAIKHDALTPKGKEMFEDAARAAITAMREPTTAMVEAFYRAYEKPLSPDRWESRFSNAMEAMIDAALEGEVNE